MKGAQAALNEIEDAIDRITIADFCSEYGIDLSS